MGLTGQDRMNLFIIFKKLDHLQISPPSAVACPSSVAGYCGGRATEDGLIDDKDSRGPGFPVKINGIFDKDSSERLK
ncbi:MAG: hypothetical protein ABIG67_11125 [Pseudomonadota bacterium]